MKDVPTLNDLKALFDSKVLKESENDFVIFDGGYAGLYTEKDYSFCMSCDDIAWSLMEKLGIPAQGA